MHNLQEIIQSEDEDYQKKMDAWIESLQITPEEGYFRFERNDAIHLDEDHLGLLLSNNTFAANHDYSDGTLGRKSDNYGFWRYLEKQLDGIEKQNHMKRMDELSKKTWNSLKRSS